MTSDVGSSAPGGTTAERIVAAALDGFAARGVEATSLDQLAARIGVRKQTILYWYPSKEVLLDAVVDHALATVESRITRAVASAAARDGDGLTAAVDAIFRLGASSPQLLALVREVARVGGHALVHLGEALDPVLDRAADAVVAAAGSDQDRAAIRALLVEAGARVVGMATEAELRRQLGRAPDLAWLRRRRTTLLDDLRSGLPNLRDGATRSVPGS